MLTRERERDSLGYPVAVEDDNCVGSTEVDTQSASASTQQKQEIVRLRVEGLYLQEKSLD